METFRVAPTAMTERLDPGHYRPVLVENDALLRRFGARDLAKLYLRSGIGHTAAVTPHYTSTDDGVAFVSGGCIVDGHLDLASAARIRHSAHVGVMNGSRLEPGWVLLVRKGELGNSAVVPTGDELNCSSEVMFLQMRPEVDSGFVSSYFNSRHGRMAFLRQQRGMMITSISLYDVPDLPAPRVQPHAASYIGDKVRQAERLRERARRLEAAVRRDYRAEIERLGYVEVPHRKSFRTKLRDRLDPAYYDPAFTSVLDAPWLTRNSEPLSRFFFDGSYGDLPDSGTYGTGGKWLLRATDLDQCMTHWDAGLSVPAAEVGAKSEVKENDILLEVKGAIEKCAIGRGPAVGKHVNGTVFRFSPSGINSGYLCLHLTAEIKRKYAAREAVNNIIQYLNLDCIRALPVLRLDVELEGRLGRSFIEAIDARTAATTLTSAATTLVEHLIDGHITEAELVAAQKALESGDRGADHAILKALRQSAAPDSKPLIADVDALYALLDGSEGQDA